MMDRMEEVLMELNHFEKRQQQKNGGDSSDAPKDEIPEILEEYLVFVAQTGNTQFPWLKIKPLFKSKLEKVIGEFASSSEEVPPMPNVDPFRFSNVKDKVFEQLECFAGIPFTVQRLCELLTAPSKHYRRTDKFMRALEKNMLVVSTVEAVTEPNSPNPAVANGFDSFSSTYEQREKEQQRLQAAAAAANSANNNGQSTSDNSEITPSTSNGIESRIVENGSEPETTSEPATTPEVAKKDDEEKVPDDNENSEKPASNETDSETKDTPTVEPPQNDKPDNPTPDEESMEIDSECSTTKAIITPDKEPESETKNPEEEEEEEVEKPEVDSSSIPPKEEDAKMEEETPSEEEPAAKKAKTDEDAKGEEDMVIESSQENNKIVQVAKEEESTTPEVEVKEDKVEAVVDKEQIEPEPEKEKEKEVVEKAQDKETETKSEETPVISV